MLRATRVIRASRIEGPIIDAVILDHEHRRACAGAFRGVKGTHFTLALEDRVTLRGGDALMLETGDFVEVVAEAERLIEVRAADVAALARIAWALGDRHVPVQILPNRLRLRPDSRIDALLQGLGAKIVGIEAPFDPEGGAYAPLHHHHGHGDSHDHRHGGAHE
jgi:urease accessory protein